MIEKKLNTCFIKAYMSEKAEYMSLTKGYMSKKTAEYINQTKSTMIENS